MLTQISEIDEEFTAEFSFDPSKGGFICEWVPRTPEPADFEADEDRWGRFWAAYTAERDVFVQKIADITGEGITLVDTPCSFLPSGQVKNFEPGAIRKDQLH